MILAEQVILPIDSKRKRGRPIRGSLLKIIIENYLTVSLMISESL